MKANRIWGMNEWMAFQVHLGNQTLWYCRLVYDQHQIQRVSIDRLLKRWKTTIRRLFSDCRPIFLRILSDYRKSKNRKKSKVVHIMEPTSPTSVQRRVIKMDAFDRTLLRTKLASSFFLYADVVSGKPFSVFATNYKATLW